MSVRLDPWAAAGLDRLRRGHFPQAAVELEAALKRAATAEPWLKSRAAEAWCCQGLSSLFADDLDRARSAFERSLALCPSTAARRGLARIHHRRGEPVAALSTLEPATGSARGVEHHLLRAVSLEALGERSEARRALDDALAAALGDPLDGVPRPGPAPRPRRRQGADGWHAHEVEEEPTSHADAHCRAAARIFERDPREAAVRLERALELNADFLRARVLLALANLRVGRPARALLLLERARELEPGYPDVLAWLGMARLRAGDRLGAERALEQAIGLERGFGRGHRFLSLVRHSQGRTRDALAEARRGLARIHDLAVLPSRLRVPGLEAEGADEEDLVRGLAIRPGSPDLHLALGRRRLESGQTSQARDALRQALALQPGYAAALFELGRAELALGSTHAAAGLLARLTRERPGWVDAQAMLGRARLRAGDSAGAIAPLRAALRRRPSLAAARADLHWALLAIRGRSRHSRRKATWWEVNQAARESGECKTARSDERDVSKWILRSEERRS